MMIASPERTTLRPPVGGSFARPQKGFLPAQKI
jgi:hypothetical protein